MEFFRIRRDIPFMRHALVFNIISALTFFAAVFFLVTRRSEEHTSELQSLV